MKRILIVEDDQKIALALQVRLKANRYAVSVASDAIVGASLGRTVKPDLILLDISMPGGDGFQLAATFHNMLETMATPIIFITASKNPELLQKVMKLGAVGLFEKPFDTEKLLYSIERELNRSDSLTVQKSAGSAGLKQDHPEPKQVLIIEDDQNLAMALSLRLKAAGYGTTTTYDALTGLNAAVSNPPALVLLDISMPAGNGFSVAEKIQTLIPTPTPIIFLTASKKPDFRERAKKLGAAGYFEKPYEAEELFGAIEQALA
jgi:DNA-binding response OmpR family regulator